MHNPLAARAAAALAVQAQMEREFGVVEPVALAPQRRGSGVRRGGGRSDASPGAEHDHSW